MYATYHKRPTQPVVKLLHLTDMHLFADPDQSLLGINTAQSFQAVLDAIAARETAFDYVLATGDLSQDQSLQSYQRFETMVAGLEKPIFWLCGNHDNAENMAHAFEHSAQILPHKQILVGEWQILMLNSQVKNAAHGKLSERELQWLEHKLAKHPNRHSLIVLHHHILPSDSAWLDQHNLRNHFELKAILNRYPQIKGVLYGHIHQAMDRRWQLCQMMATPSTCFQFQPNSAEFNLATDAQGWREIALHEDGRIETRVMRLENAILPDLTQKGYE